MRFSETKLPGGARELDRGLRARAGPAHIAGNQDHVRFGFRNARRNRADAGSGDELHADARIWINLFQIVNELRQILDRVDIVVRGG